MKKILSCALLLALFISMSACGGTPAVDTADDASKSKTPPETSSELGATSDPETNTLDLTGQWKQINPDSEDIYYAAVIDEEKIELHRISDDGGTRYLYWAGSFVPPDVEDGPYSWTSQVGKRRTDTEAIAAHEGTKPFTYENGQIRCSVLSDETETTILLEKEKWEPGLGISNVPDELRSGFDPATNQIFIYEGIKFSLPSYFTDRLEDSADSDNTVHFYQKNNADYHANLSFQTIWEGYTQAEFEEWVPEMVDNWPETRPGVTVLKFERNTVAGLPAFAVIYEYYYLQDGLVLTSAYLSYIYSPQNDGCVLIRLTRGNGDMSGYDYGADFQKMLETAQLYSTS